MGKPKSHWYGRLAVLTIPLLVLSGCGGASDSESASADEEGSAGTEISNCGVEVGVE